MDFGIGIGIATFTIITIFIVLMWIEDKKQNKIKQYMNNKITKRDIVEGIGFVLMVMGILFMVCAMHELNEVNKEVKELINIMRK